MANRNDLGDAERAVFELMQAKGGTLSAPQCALYRRQIAHLERHGLVVQAPDGSYRSTEAPTERRKSSPPPMPTLVTRVPQDVLDALDAEGPTRSDAARAALMRGLRRGPSPVGRSGEHRIGASTRAPAGSSRARAK